VRVIAGELRGRRLFAPHGILTRPTLDRVKEALFSILGDLRGARVLDCFAGTGSLGIEALSRGAEHATFVEHAKPALAVLRRNLETLGLGPRSRVLAERIERVMKVQPWDARAFDLVLFDPPYAMIRDGSMLRLATLGEKALADSLADGARIMLEHPSPLPPPPLPGLDRYDTRKYGDTALSFYRRP
jgi:16S rRNA (guanine966-N2)-methyltransferase